MKSKINLTLALGVLVFIAMACNASFTTANISSFSFGKNDKAEPSTTTFNAGEKVYAVANVSNTSSKIKVRFKVESVSDSSQQPLTKEVELPSAGRAYLEISTVPAGEYKAEATLFDESGKEIDKKSGTFTVKGGETDKKESTSDPDDK